MKKIKDNFYKRQFPRHKNFLFIKSLRPLLSNFTRFKNLLHLFLTKRIQNISEVFTVLLFRFFSKFKIKFEDLNHENVQDSKKTVLSDVIDK